MRRVVPAVLLLALLGRAAMAEGAATAPAPAPALAADQHDDCDQLVPASAATDRLAAPTTSPALRLDLLVVTERRLLDQVRRDVATATRSYAAVGVTLAARYSLVRAVPDLGDDTTVYLTWLKGLYGGARPRGADAVYLATDRYLGAGGQADCIGGIGFADHAFGVGMTSFDGLVGVEVDGVDLPVDVEPPVRDGGALVLVHEVGHLLGAHHHYGYACVHAATPDDPTRPCDVMDTTSPQLTGLRFGPVNAAVVREQAERFLR